MKIEQLNLEFSFEHYSARRAKRKLGGLRFPGHLTDADLIDFNQAQRIIWKILSDGQPHDPEEFIKATGQREALRRVREVRAKLELFNFGTIIIVTKCDSRNCSYKWVGRKEDVR